MLYQILTIVNIIASSATIFFLLRLITRYYTGPRRAGYIVGLIIALVMLMMVQFYTLTYPPQRFGTWVYKLPSFFYIGLNMYYAWMERFSLVRKDGKVLPDKKIENE